MFPTIHGVLSGATAVANWYDGAIAAYQPKGAASYAESLLDLSGNGNDASEGVAPSWASGTGWTFNGQWLKTPVIPAADNSSTMIVAFANSENTGIIAGSDGGAGQRFWIRPNNGSQVNYGHGANVGAASPSLVTGVLAMSGYTAYRNGVFDATIAAFGSIAKVAIQIGRRGGTNDFSWSGDIKAIGIWNTTLDAATVATISAQMAAL